MVSNTQTGNILPIEDQFYDGDKRYAATQCPISTNAIDKLLEFPLSLYNSGLCSILPVSWCDYTMIPFCPVLCFLNICAILSF